MTLYAFRYFVIRPFYAMSGTLYQLTEAEFALMVGITMLIAATGYIINDFYDIGIDRINRPEKPYVSGRITPPILLSSAGLLSMVAMAGSAVFSLQLHSVFPLLTFLLALGTVWWYAKTLKFTYVLGNLAVSLMSALTLGMAWFFEWLKLKQAGTELYEIKPITIITAGIVCFAFLLSLLREIVKDMEDLEGDRQFGCHSVPVVKGIPFSKILVTVLSLILLLLLAGSQFWLNRANFPFVSGWLFPAVELPLILFIIRLRKAENVPAFHRLSGLLKWIMVGGISSMAIMALNFIL